MCILIVSLWSNHERALLLATVYELMAQKNYSTKGTWKIMVPFQTLVSDTSHLRLARSIIFKSDEAKTSCMGECNCPTNPLAAFAYIHRLLPTYDGSP